MSGSAVFFAVHVSKHVPKNVWTSVPGNRDDYTDFLIPKLFSGGRFQICCRFFFKGPGIKLVFFHVLKVEKSAFEFFLSYKEFEKIF